MYQDGLPVCRQSPIQAVATWQVSRPGIKPTTTRLSPDTLPLNHHATIKLANFRMFTWQTWVWPEKTQTMCCSEIVPSARLRGSFPSNTQNHHFKAHIKLKESSQSSLADRSRPCRWVNSACWNTWHSESWESSLWAYHPDSGRSVTGSSALLYAGLSAPESPGSSPHTSVEQQHTHCVSKDVPLLFVE